MAHSQVGRYIWAPPGTPASTPDTTAATTGRSSTSGSTVIRCSTPTLLLFGTGDPAFDRSLAEDLLADRHRYADDAWLDFIDGAGHYVPDEQPGRVLEQALRHFSSPGSAT